MVAEPAPGIPSAVGWTPGSISKIGLTDRLLSKSVAQLRRSGDELLSTRHKRPLHGVAIRRGASLGGKLANGRGDLEELRGSVLLFGREAVAGGDLLRDLLEGERQVELGGGSRVAQRRKIVHVALGAHAAVIPSSRGRQTWRRYGRLEQTCKALRRAYP